MPSKRVLFLNFRSQTGNGKSSDSLNSDVPTFHSKTFANVKVARRIQKKKNRKTEAWEKQQHRYMRNLRARKEQRKSNNVTSLLIRCQWLGLMVTARPLKTGTSQKIKGQTREGKTFMKLLTCEVYRTSVIKFCE